jgi:phage terminase small subunit
MATRKPAPKAKAPAKAKGKPATPKALPPAKKPKPRTAAMPAAAGDAAPRSDIEHGGSKLVDRDLPSALNPDEEAFVTEYLRNGLNGTAAALRVWPALSPMAAAVKASRLIKVGKVRLRIQSERERIATRHEMTREELLGALVDIVRADPNELVSMRCVACTFCWGGKEGQSTEGEGKAFSRFLEPDPECVWCNGEGFPTLRISDTTKVSREARALYAGVHQTKEGVKVLMHSKLDAAEKIAKIIGAYEEDNRQKVNALGALLERIGRSSLPVVANPE